MVASNCNKRTYYEYLRTAHFASFENEEAIKDSDLCGCFYCERIFESHKISDEDWIEDENALTAVCPFCGIDAVIGEKSGYPLNQEFLHQMYLVWFENVTPDELAQIADSSK